MKKLLVSTLLGLVAFASTAATVTVNVPANTMSNLMVSTTFPIKITGVIVTATTATNTSINLMDVSSSSLRRINPAYTNTISYATNLISLWTNYYGVTFTFTNVALVRVTNNAVAAVTNTVAPTVTLSSAASASTEVNGVSYYFNYGLWATNTTTAPAAVTITYSR